MMTVKRKPEEPIDENEVKKAKFLSPSAVLNEKQLQVIEMAKLKKNIFLTGSAGVGKSFILTRLIKKTLPEIYDDRVGVTGSTGVASVQIGAVTIHSLFSIHPRIVKSGKVPISETWNDIDVLVIDEISMVHPDLFLFMHKQAQKSRNNYNEPFGGVCLILVGDFFQLPPVHKGIPDIKFVFELDIWNELFHGDQGFIIELTQVFRQSNRVFVDMLERIRRGKVNLADSQSLSSCIAQRRPGVILTKLFGHRKKVDAMNIKELGKLNIKPKIFNVSFEWNVHESMTAFQKQKISKKIMNSLPVKECLVIKKQAQVMMVANVCVQAGLANGTRGVVVDFDIETGFPIIQFEKFKCIVRPHEWPISLGKQGHVTVKCIPLTLAYAITIHKSQGQSIDGLEVDMGGFWAPGQAYTALSRAKSLKYLTVRNFKSNLIKADPKVCAYYNTLQKKKVPYKQKKRSS
jgi:ATP-dependent DNA helicase PIF1